MAGQNSSTKFKSGSEWTGNAGGKPLHARNRLTNAFLNDLLDDYTAHGLEAIQEMRETKPAEYVKVLASLLPKEFSIERPLSEINDDELDALVNAFREAEGVLTSLGGRAEVQGKPKQPKKV